MLKLIFFFLIAMIFKSSLAADPACSDPIFKGPCKGFYKRFAINTDENECIEFVYGGCDGNGNNFKTLDECEAACKN
ncbi:trypsin inhibitor-like [Choristoneura fumiferana]|uniref:trypsin inhibitor-like n=1 Tax=Choristoneura fumiferana TaxID=7141 RepID=UPI003D15C1B0